MNGENKDECQHSSLENKLECRVKELIDLFPDRLRAINVSGLSRAQLNRYLNGDSNYSFIPLSLMAKDRGISLDWLATGEGEKMAKAYAVREESAIYSVNSGETYLKALELCEEVLQAKNVNLKPGKKVELVRIVANMLQKSESDEVKSNILHLVALAL